MKTTKAGELAKALLAEFPTAGSLTLAKRLAKDYPEHFETVEAARALLRDYKGEMGGKARRMLADASFVKDKEKYLRDKFALPEPAVKSYEPYIVPKNVKKIIIFGDLHFPYQDNKTIYSAIEYGLRKNVDCIILNGDCLDMYQDSRFTKDSRKPSIDYEIELFYQFLIDLRETFPNKLIIWKFGNHEERYDTYWKTSAPNHYSHAGSLDEAVLTPELNIIVVKDKRRIVAGDLNILHGHEYGSGAGSVNPARAMFLKARVNTLVNHFHRSSSHRGLDLNGNVTRVWSLGSSCARQDYSPYGDQDNSFGYLEIVNGKTFVTVREV